MNAKEADLNETCDPGRCGYLMRAGRPRSQQSRLIGLGKSGVPPAMSAKARTSGLPAPYAYRKEETTRPERFPVGKRD